MSLAQKGRHAPWVSGKNSKWWKGGITDKYKDIRKSTKYRKWRKLILNRDNYICVICKKEGNTVDHIIPFASILEESEVIKNKELLFDIDNGRTLCQSCHKKTPTYNQKLDKQIESILLNTIKSSWEQQNRPNEDFEVFYRMKMEQLINAVKDKLE